GDVSRFRASVEQWYDDHMDRVSGWYKRNAAKITLAAGAILIVLLNINALTIGRTLYTESAVSMAVSNVAAKGTSCPAGQKPQDCLANLQAQLSAAATAGLPIGWATVRDCLAPTARCNWLDQRGLFSRHGHSFWQFVLVLVGLLIMIIAIAPGAQFWFGLLTKIGPLRATGPNRPGPETSNRGRHRNQPSPRGTGWPSCRAQVVRPCCASHAWAITRRRHPAARGRLIDSINTQLQQSTDGGGVDNLYV